MWSAWRRSAGVLMPSVLMKCWTAGLSRRSRIGEVVRLIDQRIEIDDSREKRPIDPKTKIVDPDVFECELHGRNGRYLSSAKISGHS